MCNVNNIIFANRIFFFVIFSLIVHSQLLDPCSDKFDIVTDFHLEDCPSGSFYVKSGNPIYDCFPTCVNNYPNFVGCNPLPCPPGHVCKRQSLDPDDTKCVVDKDSCLKYYAGDKSSNPWLSAMFKPECLPDGSWAPKQCKGEKSNGRCFCFDAVGNRIFGQAFVQSAGNMTCGCSRKRDELIKSKSRFYASLHCDSVGNYEPLQCDSGQCWCVEPLTGEIIVKVVPERMMSYLPCYVKNNIGVQYLRQCESEEFGQANVLNELKVHGTKYANLPHVMCDADGSYGHYQIGDGRTTCTWRDKTSLNHEAPLDHEPENLNCNCARDKKIYQLQGLAHNLQCLANGNYRPEQQATTGKWYCVDDDGFRKTNYFNSLPSNCKDFV